MADSMKMAQGHNDTNKIESGKRRALGVSLALFLFAAYLFVYRGGFHSVDEVSMFAVTENLVKFGAVNTDQIAWTQWTTTQAEAQGFFGRDGHVYSKKGLALSLAQAPFYWLGLVVPGLGMLQTVTLLNAVITALTGALLLMFLWRMDFSTPAALLTALVFGLATIAFVYAKYLFSEPLAGFLLLLAAYMLFAYRQEGGRRHVAIAGLAAGLAVMTRANNLFLLPAFGLYLLWVAGNRDAAVPVTRSQGRSMAGPPTPAKITRHASRLQHYALRFTQPETLKSIATFLLSLAVPGIILLAYNAARAGNPFQTGYDLTLFSPNILLGLYKLLFSPLRGLFVYSPILLLSLPGWWLLTRSHPAEAWLFAGLVGVTVALFSAWSSGEGLSWGSRFLVPVVPFLALCLAPLLERLQIMNYPTGRLRTEMRIANGRSRLTHSSLFIIHYALLLLSLLIQILGVTINPWVFLARIQAEFGGEFFLENTNALYDFRYSQIAGQLQSFSPENSDLVWWQPWGFDGLAFGLSLLLVILTGIVLTATMRIRYCDLRLAANASPNPRQALRPNSRVTHSFGFAQDRHASLITRYSLRVTRYASLVMAATALLIAFAALFLLTRYQHTDRQFGPPNDGYTQALADIAAADPFGSPVVTVAQNHYHVPMNRFKARHPLIGFAQQSWPPPDTALPLLTLATNPPNTWLVTVGFPPAAPDNAAEQWLARHTYKISDDWGDDSARLVRFTASQPTEERPIAATLGDAIQLETTAVLNPARPGDPLPAALDFRALAHPQADLTIFVQLLNIEGGVIAQTNSPPVAGYAPTTGWLPGQQLTSRHGLLIPVEAAPGDYRLITGLFNPLTGRRLPVDSGADFVELGVITIDN